MEGNKNYLGGFCPICGKFVEKSELLVAGTPNQHRCDPKILKGIDVADQRDEHEPHMRSLYMTEKERYKDGFGLLGRKKEDY